MSDGQVWCAGEGAYFAATEFEDQGGLVVHAGRGHTIAGDPIAYGGQNGPLGRPANEL